MIYYLNKFTYVLVILLNSILYTYYIIDFSIFMFTSFILLPFKREYLN